MQQKWITKLMGFDYEIVFRAGKENLAADALSRHGNEMAATNLALTTVQPTWLHVLKHSVEVDEELQGLISQLTQHPQDHPKYV